MCLIKWICKCVSGSSRFQQGAFSVIVKLQTSRGFVSSSIDLGGDCAGGGLLPGALQHELLPPLLPRVEVVE